MMTKRCSKCRTVKPVDQFGRNKTRKDGLQATCKQCRNHQAKKHYQLHHTQYKEKAAQVRRKAGRKEKHRSPITAEVLAFWNYTKNQPLNPTLLGSTSKRKVWWVCSEGHEWERKIVHQKPYCQQCEREAKLRNLTITHPHLVEQWHKTKNDTALFTETLTKMTDKTWWVCGENHEWEASISSRTTSNTGCPVCAVKVRNTREPVNPLNSPKLSQEWSPANNKTPEEVSTRSGYSAEWVCSACQHTWKARVGDRAVRGYGCPKCAKKISQAEKNLQNWTENLSVPVETNTRKIINPYELDIYFPEHNLAVEFNGLYWHTEQNGKHRTYHHTKWLKCKNQGIQLIQIWEDDWKRNPGLVKRMLAHKLGISKERKVYARGTCVTELSKKETEKFLNANHIQGHGNGTHYLGLRDIEKEELVAVLVLKNEPHTNGKTLNIIRYATSCNVVGGFTKLLKHAERTYNPETFITFADHCVSDGGLYEKNGFVADKELPPDYMYVVEGVRKHKFGYRLKRFRDDPNLLWEEGLTEKQLAELNQIPRIWDAGKTRWKKIVK